MIIQCENCNAKFKLDDSKIKPEGVKVRCKKCNHIFLVFPEKPAELQVMEDIQISPSEQKTTEEFSTGDFSSKPEFEKTIEEKKGESIDGTWGGFINLEEEQKKSEEEVKENFTLDFFTKGETQETLIDEKVKEEKSSEETFDIEFGLDALKTPGEQIPEKESVPEENNMPISITDFTLDGISEQKLDEKIEVQSVMEYGKESDEMSIQPPRTEDLDISFPFSEDQDSEQVKTPPKDFTFINTEDEDIKEKDKYQQKVEEKPILQPEDFLTQTPKKFNLVGLLVSLLIIIGIGGGGVGYMWWQRVQLLEKVGSFGLSNVKTFYWDSKETYKLLVVKGKIRNDYNIPKSFLRVKGVLLGKNNVKLVEKTVFAGNVFTDSEVKELTYQEIEKGLNNKMGKSMVNVDVPPGKSLDFMVVFNNVPDDAVAVEVEGL